MFDKQINEEKTSPGNHKALAKERGKTGVFVSVFLCRNEMDLAVAVEFGILVYKQFKFIGFRLNSNSNHNKIDIKNIFSLSKNQKKETY